MPTRTKKPASKTQTIGAYLAAQKPEHAAICRALKLQISKGLPKAKAKIYHRLPVWFIGENAVVGFYVTANKGVNLLFWNGQALGEPALKATGSFKAAQIQFKNLSEIDRASLRRWLKKAGKNIWDFAALRRSV